MFESLNFGLNKDIECNIMLARIMQLIEFMVSFMRILLCRELPMFCKFNRSPVILVLLSI